MLILQKLTERVFQIFVIGAFLYLSGCASSEVIPALAEKPNRQDLYQGQSHLALSIGSPQSELQALERAMDEERSGNFDKALYSYIQALDFNKSNPETLYKIARIHVAKGNEDIANRAYNEALILNPLHLLANAELGILEFDQRKYNHARLHLEQAVAIDQQRLNGHDIEKRLEHAIALDELSPLRVYNAIAILEDLENNHDKAKDYFRLVLDFQPQSAVIATNFGYSYYLTGDLINAEYYFRQALKGDSNFGRAWSNLGLIYIRKGQYEKALVSFEQTMTKADAFNDLGYFLMLEGHYPKAIEMFHKAIDSSPSYFERAQKNLKIALASKIN
jgi:tetratricopeptide (TPR) repeat protein